MTPLAERWLESYAKWPPQYQLGFSIALVGAGVLLVVLFGFWLSGAFGQAVVALRGWPADQKRLAAVEGKAEDAWRSLRSVPLPAAGDGYDWKKEQQAAAEERAYQDKLLYDMGGKP